MRKTIATILAMAAVLLLLAGPLSPALAARYDRAGAITLPAHVYGLGAAPHTNVTSQIIYVQVANRSDQSVQIYLDFYDNTGTLVASDQAGTLLAANDHIFIQTNTLPDLASYSGVDLTCVVKYSGQMDITPMATIIRLGLDSSSNLTTAQIETYYDDDKN